MGFRVQVPCVNFEGVLLQLKKVQSKSQFECRKKESEVVAWVKQKPRQFPSLFQKVSPIACFTGTWKLFLVALLLCFFPEIWFSFQSIGLSVSCQLIPSSGGFGRVERGVLSYCLILTTKTQSAKAC